MTGPVIRLDGTASGGPAVLGAKAAGLDRMVALGLPVPPAFVIPVDVHARRRRHGRVPDDVWAAVRDEMTHLASVVGRRFGEGPVPLLMSVRSGAATTMPGMLASVLDVGLTPDLRDELAAATGASAFADDTWRRLCASWADVVGPGDPPADVWAQLAGAIEAVYGSWDGARARAYRARRGLPDDGGTAVTVQVMVYGNRDEASGVGVLSTRDPQTGDAQMRGEWLPGAQGDDLMSGAVTPRDLTDLARNRPAVHRSLLDAARTVEDDLGDVAEIEFTVESGTLWLLQRRLGTRPTPATVQVAVRPGAEAVAHGIPAGGGVAAGDVVTDPDEARDRSAEGERVVLVREMTSPADVPAMLVSAAVVTARGGATSHAAVVCREAGLPCVVGVGDDAVDALAGSVTVDGDGGVVYGGDVTVV